MMIVEWIWKIGNRTLTQSQKILFTKVGEENEKEDDVRHNTEPTTIGSVVIVYIAIQQTPIP